MRFKFWLAIARTCRRLMVWAAGRAMAADPNVLVFARRDAAISGLNAMLESMLLAAIGVDP